MKREYRRKLLQFRIVFLFVIIGLLMDAAMVAISFVSYTDSMNNSYGKICAGVTQVMTSGIDGNNIQKWLDGKNTDRYYAVKQMLSRLRNSVSDIENIYVYTPRQDGLQVIFDVNTTGLEKTTIGTVVKYNQHWNQYKADMLAGNNIPIMVTDDESGWLMTAAKPILNYNGECVAYACCDFSMSVVAKDRESFMKTLLLLLSVASVLVIVVAIIYVEKHIVYPINRLDVYLRSFALDNSTKPIVKDKLASLKVDTGKEVEGLKKSMSTLIDNISDYTGEVIKLRDNVVNGIISMIDNRNRNDEEHANLAAQYTKVILDEMRKSTKYSELITDEMYSNIIRAAPLYDIGELGISDTIRKKPGKLTEEEYERIKQHTVNGSKLIDDTIGASQSEEYVSVAKQMAEFHHEHWDGSGYPNRLKGEQIPLAARIIAVPDVFNAIVSKREYKTQKSLEEAFDIITAERGIQFDADVVDAFMAGRTEVEKIARQKGL